MNGSLSIPNTLSNANKSRYVLTKDDNTSNAETPSICKRKAGVFSAEKHPKSIRQGSAGINWERGYFYSFLQSNGFSYLSVSPNRFCFSANMDEDSELADEVLNGEFPELTKKISFDSSKKP